MLKHSKTWLLALTAVLLGAMAGSASARNLSLVNSNTGIRAVWTRMEFISPGTGVTVRCPVTLEGTLHSRTIAKVLNTLMGYITRAIVGEAGCEGGTARVRTETLPWHVRYLGFTGTLPRITAIVVNVARPGFDVTANFFGFRVTCTYRSSTVKGTFSREAGGALTSASVEGRNMPPDQGFPCEPGELAGTSNAPTLLGTTTRLTVTLI